MRKLFWSRDWLAVCFVRIDVKNGSDLKIPRVASLLHRENMYIVLSHYVCILIHVYLTHDS